MIRNIERRWFEVWGTETAQNRFLKGLLALLIALLMVEAIAILALGVRKPTLIAISPSETNILKLSPPTKEILESEAVRTCREYVAKHYNWDYQQIDASQKDAATLVAPDFAKAFAKANAEQIRMAKEKRVSQKFYLDQVIPDFRTKVVRVTGNRILIIDGLRATNPMTLEVSYDEGPRTESNPAGIYVTADKLITDSDGK